MSLKDFIIYKIFRSSPKNPGALLDDPKKLESLPKHELFAGGAASKDWARYLPDYRYQGTTYYCTAYVATTLGALFEKIESGKSLVFSPAELFHRAPYAGSLKGNYLLNAANAAKEGFVFEEDVPTVIPDRWDYETHERMKRLSQASKEQRERGKPYRIKEHAIVQPSTPYLRQALQVSPLSIAIPIGRGYWDKVAPAPPENSINAWHNVLLLDIDTNGVFHIFDSLKGYGGFNGNHFLAPDYPITYAMSFIDLPNDWRDQQDKIETPHKGALQHYGEKRVLTKEQRIANEISQELKKHPTLQGFFGREWTTIINAVSYGGYSLTDLLNHFTHIRRTGKPIFDLNKKRNYQ